MVTKSENGDKINKFGQHLKMVTKSETGDRIGEW